MVLDLFRRREHGVARALERLCFRRVRDAREVPRRVEFVAPAGRRPTSEERRSPHVGRLEGRRKWCVSNAAQSSRFASKISGRDAVKAAAKSRARFPAPFRKWHRWRRGSTPFRSLLWHLPRQSARPSLVDAGDASAASRKRSAWRRHTPKSPIFWLRLWPKYLRQVWVRSKSSPRRRLQLRRRRRPSRLLCDLSGSSPRRRRVSATSATRRRRGVASPRPLQPRRR